MLGSNMSAKTKVQSISKEGMWVFLNNQEFFLSFSEYPWFQKATIEQIYDLQLLHGKHLHWPMLGIDIEVELLKNPSTYPLKYSELNKIMIEQSTIDEAIRRLVKAYNPLQIYLYGYYALGTPNEESTFDLLIIVEASSEERVIKRGYLAYDALFGLRIPKTVTVLTKTEFDRFVQDQYSTAYEAKTRGKILYDQA